MSFLRYRVVALRLGACMMLLATILTGVHTASADDLQGQGMGIKTTFPCHVDRGPGTIPAGSAAGSNPGSGAASGDGGDSGPCTPAAAGSRFTTEVLQLDSWSRTPGATYQGSQLLLLQQKVRYGSESVTQYAGWVSDARHTRHNPKTGVRSVRSKMQKFCYVSGPSGAGNQVIRSPSNTQFSTSHGSKRAQYLRLEKADACRLDPNCLAASCGSPNCSPMQNPDQWEWQCGFGTSDWISSSAEGKVIVTSPHVPVITDIWHGFWSWDTGANNNFDGHFKLHGYWPPPASTGASWSKEKEVFWGTDGYSEDEPVVLYQDHGNHAPPPGGAFAWNACMGIVKDTPCPGRCEACESPAFGGKDGEADVGGRTIPMRNWVWSEEGVPPLKWAVVPDTFPSHLRSTMESSTRQSVKGWNEAMGFEIFEPEASDPDDADVLVKGSTIDDFPDGLVELPESIKRYFKVTPGTFGIAVPSRFDFFDLLVDECPGTPLEQRTVLPITQVTIFIFHDRAEYWTGCELQRWPDGPDPGDPPYKRVPSRPLIAHELGHALGSDHCDDCEEGLMSTHMAAGTCHQYKAVPIEVRDAIICSLNRR